MGSIAKLEGRETMLAVAKALGIEEQPLQRIVIDIQLDKAVTVYTQGVVYQAKFDEVLGLLVKAKPVVVQAAGG